MAHWVLPDGYMEKIMENLRNAPEPAEHTEIIRCKQCRHRGRLECPFGITAFDAPTDDDFCSRAERRTDEKTD